jgi:hypothetical protein
MSILEVLWRTVSMPHSNRLSVSFFRSRSVVRGVLSAAILLSLILFGAISFVLMVGVQPVSHDAMRGGKGSLSDSRISAQVNRARR